MNQDEERKKRLDDMIAKLHNRPVKPLQSSTSSDETKQRRAENARKAREAKKQNQEPKIIKEKTGPRKVEIIETVKQQADIIKKLELAEEQRQKRKEEKELKKQEELRLEQEKKKEQENLRALSVPFPEKRTNTPVKTASSMLPVDPQQEARFRKLFNY